MEPTGAELSAAYWEQVVRPLVQARWPRMPLAAGRLGSGSDVLGLDDETSRDHDWGLRLNLLVPRELADDVDAHLELTLPDEFALWPVRFATTWDPVVRHRVQVEDAGTFAASRLGLDASRDLTVDEWLSLTGQAVLEVTAGPVFTDTAGELTGIRHRLAWYPDDLWRHVVAVDWARLGHELPFVGRTAERGDDLGSRVVTARLVGECLHLGFLLERRWPPYSKWTGTLFARLPAVGAATPLLTEALTADDWHHREDALVAVLRRLSVVQREAGLPSLDDPVEPFWDRPYRGVRDAAVTVLTDTITSDAVRSLPRGIDRPTP